MTDKPKRIQRKRIKGWTQPRDAIYVGRPTRFGNPFIVGQPCVVDGMLYKVANPSEAVRLFELWFVQDNDRMRSLRLLKGHDLACWCPLNEPCHADILLKLANEQPQKTDHSAGQTPTQRENLF